MYGHGRYRVEDEPAFYPEVGGKHGRKLCGHNPFGIEVARLQHEAACHRETVLMIEAAAIPSASIASVSRLRIKGVGRSELNRKLFVIRHPCLQPTESFKASPIRVWTRANRIG